MVERRVGSRSVFTSGIFKLYLMGFFGTAVAAGIYVLLGTIGVAEAVMFTFLIGGWVGLLFAIFVNELTPGYTMEGKL